MSIVEGNVDDEDKIKVDNVEVLWRTFDADSCHASIRLTPVNLTIYSRLFN